jgi:hypothetical protein
MATGCKQLGHALFLSMGTSLAVDSSNRGQS